MFWCDIQNISRRETEGWRNHFRSGPLRFAGFQVRRFQVSISASSSGVRGERTDYLEGFQRPQEGDVRLDRCLHTTEGRVFAGTRALRTKSCVVLLDTGSPASLIPKKVWNDMLGSGGASSDGEAPTSPEDGADSTRNRQPPEQACN